jgi:hypothetical protein
MRVVNASNHHTLVVVPLDDPIATTKNVLFGEILLTTYLAR